MSTMKREVEIKPASLGEAIVSNTVKSHAGDPVVIKKAEEAKAFLRKQVSQKVNKHVLS